MATPSVVIEIGGPLDAVKGVGTRTRTPSRGSMMLDSPHTVEVQFPSGRAWIADSMVTVVTADGGTVIKADVMPMPRAGTIAEAVSTLDKVLNETGATCSQEMHLKLARLKSAPPAWDAFAGSGIACDIEHDTHLFAEIKPANEADMWFVVCSFYSKESFECADSARE